jgi:hypothetical protein
MGGVRQRRAAGEAHKELHRTRWEERIGVVVMGVPLDVGLAMARAGFSALPRCGVAAGCSSHVQGGAEVRVVAAWGAPTICHIAGGHAAGCTACPQG